jgi:hypothetical protein
MEKANNFLVGIYDDEDVLLDAVGKVKKSGVKIYECYTPFPVHGLDDAMGYNYSNLPIVGFLCGVTGTICALVMMIGMMGFDWPMDIGGRPYIPLPDFIPITFELTVLLCAFGMTISFFIVSNLNPWSTPRMFDPRSVDHKFVMAIDLADNKQDAASITTILKGSGATEVNKKSFE